MSHPFGELLKLYRTRKEGLSQARLAQIIGYDPALLARMAQGQRDLTGPSGRDRVVRIIETLRDEGVLHTLDEANALLAAANLPPLYAGLPAEGALLRTLKSATPPTSSTLTTLSTPLHSGSLPVPVSSFIGRDAALTELMARLSKTRLLTLTGPGGSGKTRLAIALADLATSTFDGNVRWVELAAISDADAALRVVASACNVADNASTAAHLAKHLRQSHALLVLDNCEHLLDVCAHLADALLTACPHLKIVTTTREALGVFGETVWSVPPLSVPARADLPPGVLQSTAESVRLFCERAEAVSQTFVLTERNAPYVARICIQLDGLPLAIELAAAQARALSAKQIAAMLKDQLGTLTKGSRTAPSRQQTLRATLDWSYNQLDEYEQCVLRHAGAFVGGFELDALVALEQAAGLPVDEAHLAAIVGALVSKSLVKAEPLLDVVRYTMLVMVREYGADQLAAHGEGQAARRWHVQAYLSLAETHEPHWQIEPRWQVDDNPQQPHDHMGIRMVREDDNIRAALNWCLSTNGDAELGLRLAGRLWSYWCVFSAQEGIRWLTRLLDVTANSNGGVVPAVRGRALLGLGNLLLKHDEAMARQTLEDARRILHDVGDVEGVSVALCSLSRVEGDLVRARQLLDEALQITHDIQGPLPLAREWALFHGSDILRRWSDAIPDNPDNEHELIDAIGEPYRVAAAMLHLGYVAMAQLDLQRAQTLAEQALHAVRPLGSAIESGLLMLAGEAAQLLGDLETAEPYLQRAYELIRQRGETMDDNIALALLGRVARDRGDLVAARTMFERVLQAHAKFTPGTWAIEGMACVACMDGHFERAARLFGAADGYRAAVNNPAWDKDRRDMARYVDQARAQLGAAAYDAAFAVGRAITIEQAVAFALQPDA